MAPLGPPEAGLDIGTGYRKNISLPGTRGRGAELDRAVQSRGCGSGEMRMANLPGTRLPLVEKQPPGEAQGGIGPPRRARGEDLDPCDGESRHADRRDRSPTGLLKLELGRGKGTGRSTGTAASGSCASSQCSYGRIHRRRCPMSPGETTDRDLRAPFMGIDTRLHAPRRRRGGSSTVPRELVRGPAAPAGMVNSIAVRLGGGRQQHCAAPAMSEQGSNRFEEHGLGLPGMFANVEFMTGHAVRGPHHNQEHRYEQRTPSWMREPTTHDDASGGAPHRRRRTRTGRTTGPAPRWYRRAGLQYRYSAPAYPEYAPRADGRTRCCSG